MIAFGLQHVLVMAASPIAAVFLMSKALGFDAALTTQLLSATFLVCGIGTLIQSFGPAGIGAKLPFVMLPGGAPIILIITSGENIGIIRATQVRSRYVTAVGGLFLILFGVFSPLSALISVIPASVIGATGLVVFAIVGTMGIDMLRKVDLRGHAAMYVVATALAVGLLPIVVPGIYDQLPSQCALVAGTGRSLGVDWPSGGRCRQHSLY
jgi:xanthine/uracil permease